MIRNPQALAASPFFASVAALLGRLPSGRFPATADLNALVAPGIVSGGGATIRFEPACTGDRAATPAFESGYEVRVHRDGAVSTREGNLHDLFNALVWLRFPRAKAALNDGHYRRMLLARAGSPADGTRGAARDALTLFDESGVIVASSSPRLLALLRGFEWKRLFVEHRAELVSSMRVYVFGHAILEKAVSPYRGLTGMAMLLEVDHGFPGLATDRQLEALDARVAREVAESLDGTGSLAPLPLLGLPGWCADNADPAYYDDVSQFRPGRRSGRPPA